VITDGASDEEAKNNPDSPIFKKSEMNDTSFFKNQVLEFDPPGEANGSGTEEVA